MSMDDLDLWDQIGESLRRERTGMPCVEPDYPSPIEALARQDPTYSSKLVRLTSRREVADWTSEQPGDVSVSS